MSCENRFVRRVKNFFLPEFNRRFLIRLSVIILAASLFFSVFKPCFISGSSMEPTYHDRSFVLVFRWSYLFRPVQRGDVVTIAYFERTNLLKRVVALAGDRVEFRNGRLWVNGQEQQEDYVVNPCSWNMKPLTVRPGHCFVVGDNRNQRQEEHKFGEVEVKRVNGGVWL